MRPFKEVYQKAILKAPYGTSAEQMSRYIQAEFTEEERLDISSSLFSDWVDAQMQAVWAECYGVGLRKAGEIVAMGSGRGLGRSLFAEQQQK